MHNSGILSEQFNGSTKRMRYRLEFYYCKWTVILDSFGPIIVTAIYYTGWDCRQSHMSTVASTVQGSNQCMIPPKNLGILLLQEAGNRAPRDSGVVCRNVSSVKTDASTEAGLVVLRSANRQTVDSDPGSFFV